MLFDDVQKQILFHLKRSFSFRLLADPNDEIKNLKKLKEALVNGSKFVVEEGILMKAFLLVIFVLLQMLTF
jgi:hypothetical protein